MRKSTRAQFDAMQEQFEADKVTGGYVLWTDMQDRLWGPVGTPERDRRDRNSARTIKAWRIGERVTRHLGFIGAFWYSMLLDNPGDIRSAADALSFRYLGDFMFHDGPVTEDYYQSWVSRVHFPRWLHYHVGLPEDCTHA